MSRARRAGSADQVELYESSGGTQGTTLRATGLPVVIITNRGARSGKLRKTPVMRVEHDGRYAAVASKGGAPAHPLWYYNFLADPRVELQDGAHKQDMTAREITGDEPDRVVGAWPCRHIRPTPSTSGRPRARSRCSSSNLPTGTDQAACPGQRPGTSPLMLI